MPQVSDRMTGKQKFNISNTLFLKRYDLKPVDTLEIKPELLADELEEMA